MRHVTLATSRLTIAKACLRTKFNDTIASSIPKIRPKTENVKYGLFSVVIVTGDHRMPLDVDNYLVFESTDVNKYFWKLTKT